MTKTINDYESQLIDIKNNIDEIVRYIRHRL